MQYGEKSIFSGLRLLPMLLVMAGIFWLSHQPAVQMDLPNFFLADKLAHAILYGILALSIIFVPSPRRRAHAAGSLAAVAVVVSILYGIGDEFHQSFVPGRDPSVADLMADGCGAAVAALFWWWRCRHSPTAGY